MTNDLNKDIRRALQRHALMEVVQTKLISITGDEALLGMHPAEHFATTFVMVTALAGAMINAVEADQRAILEVELARVVHLAATDEKAFQREMRATVHAAVDRSIP